MSIILASASPRRRELLSLLVSEFQVRPADVDEGRRAGESPQEYVLRLARDKARAGRRGGEWHLGSDTSVVLAGRCLGKPQGPDEAREMLLALSGRSHSVLSSVVLVGPEGHLHEALSESRVEFDPLPDEWIERYIATGEPMDKAGAYAIQGTAAAWIRHLEGSYSGVMGLPLYETAGVLRAAGFQV